MESYVAKMEGESHGAVGVLGGVAAVSVVAAAVVLTYKSYGIGQKVEGADAQKVEYGKDPFEDSLDNETKIFRRYMQNCYEENCRRHGPEKVFNKDNKKDKKNCVLGGGVAAVLAVAAIVVVLTCKS
ncbi:hypothetical protein MtrunA17_Chr8g0345261 [Medicago truncatula]|uniref:Transmembrane protein n=3 Tax=Medicago truncatula TaxID=3880 RepID=A0A396GHD1_MEDTR|nr:uncharacterized protein LOC11444634 isoform X2 [Medicago truncatula]RHN39571.1 hypothetical protein MtrunA17_Chr8g0345261 [Medicago truncatula]